MNSRGLRPLARFSRYFGMRKERLIPANDIFESRTRRQKECSAHGAFAARRSNQVNPAEAYPQRLCSRTCAPVAGLIPQAVLLPRPSSKACLRKTVCARRRGARACGCVHRRYAAPVADARHPAAAYHFSGSLRTSLNSFHHRSEQLPYRDLRRRRKFAPDSVGVSNTTDR